MANVYKPGLLQIRPQYNIDSDAPDKPENVLWFQSGSNVTPTPTNLSAIANVFDNDWYNLWTTVGAGSAHYTGSIITDWSSNTGLSWTTVGQFPPGVGGQGTALPANVSALISFQIALRWRGGHFRTYLPWIGSGALDATDKNLLSVAQQGALSTQVQTFIAAMKASGVLGGQTWSFYKDRHDPATATVYPSASYIVQRQLASQRRRLRKAAHR